MLSSQITFRTALPSESARVAELHAASWRSAYRGYLSDAYLDTDIVAERARVWQARFVPPSEVVFNYSLLRRGHRGRMRSSTDAALRSSAC